MTNVVMLVYNRPRLTEQALASLYATQSDEPFNVTVVNDCSDDFRINAKLSRFAHTKSNFTSVRIDTDLHVLSQAKNLGVAWSEQYFGRGDYLCICDNDVYFMDNWLDRMVHAVHVSELAGFKIWGGQAHPFHAPLDPSNESILNIARVQYVTEHDCLAGTHWFMQWATWDDYGPFDRTTAPGACQSEDFAFTQRIRKAGGRIGVTAPHCVVDCGITQAAGGESPGAEWKRQHRREGLVYE